ncbi:MAG: bifunctional (p)ppGpp synthetase/guanosine-3',5'-bis(diphosphate) 3'-pyrophosphohydrolase [Propionibacteriaceae bacterium]|nr:bifunctional (p)ppGpp synthetase/guanosine-3',5'-bis(diphosphate) 3'-pyrophosphohydrolase [Micropruina sp.]HBX81933.1 bifunctional (p)ppGpp synthetase/guanosine-3',5'-bis(diphosphate) 3'-pyrophosphohydrolase [Propionibacteriaceae bacterium]HBY22741.1 bifunctional (p)ppGpp synthetase/guanosine-3',5'-bis(diphosphate) 3'-pyrophosphohydrolase [Propionibacteriaceae bacterium]
MRQMLARLGATRPVQSTVLEPLVHVLRTHHPKADVQLIERAYRTAEHYHDGQMRKSGDSYITHPLAVAAILAELGMTETTLCAALLHDTVEDTSYTMAQLTADFGPEIAGLVDGVTKLDKVTYGASAKAETIRKMVIAMSRDIRVLVIKLSDRLHNMRTLHFLRQDKQTQIANDTLEIFAPLANRLGMNAVKWELEDLSFAVLQPKVYDEIVRMVAERAPLREDYLRTVIDQVRADLAAAKINASVYGRPKHYYSIYQKMVVRGRDFFDIHDLVGLRIIVDSQRDCYGALGILHARWSPLPGRFKDYIAMPKFNFYQSLHTTVLGPDAKAVEFQIRTTEMHRNAEYGVAAHWKYKEGKFNQELNWVSQINQWQKETEDPTEFLDTLRFEITSDEVFVFSPKGDVTNLVQGATPVDFAYAIHTEVGHRCIGARVNGRLVPLDSKLDNGDVVEILTSKAPVAGPSRDWLNFVASPRARSKIRQYFMRERREESIEQGKEALVKQLRRGGLPLQRWLTVEHMTSMANAFRLADVNALYAAIGEGSVSAQSVVQRLVAAEGGIDEAADAAIEGRSFGSGRRRSARVNSTGVMVHGDPDLFVKLAKCCLPVPGDVIVGFVTRTDGISVHREDCTNVEDLRKTPERMIEVNWAPTANSSYLVAIQIEGLDRAGMFSEVTKVLAELHVNIVTVAARTSKDRVFRMNLTFETPDPNLLNPVLAQIRRVPGVYDVFRVSQ